MIAAIFYARKSNEQNGVADESKSVTRQVEPDSRRSHDEHEDDAMWTCPTCGDEMLYWQQPDHRCILKRPPAPTKGGEDR